MGLPSTSRALLVAACVLVVALLAGPPAAAETFEDQVQLEIGTSTEVRIDHNTSHMGVVLYWVTVISGQPVNVWVVPEKGWVQYHDPDMLTFQHYQELSKEDTMEVIGFHIDMLEPEVLYIIIENPAHSTGVTTVHYRVEHDVDRSSIYSGPMFFMIIFSVMIAVVFMIAFNIFVRRREAMKGLKDRDEDVEIMRQMLGDIERQKPPAPRPAPPPGSPFTPVEETPPHGPPEPPPAYSDEVVRASMDDLGHDGDEAWEE